MTSASHAVVDPQTGLKTVDDATCTRCCCVCDDISLRVSGNKIVEARNACELGKEWFLQPFSASRPVSANHPVCTIAGRAATLDEGVDRAARILIEAKYPLVYGMSDTTSEAQRVAASIADWIGGTIDTSTSFRHGPTGVALQGVGEVTCTLGEIRNRGDLILFWGTDPAVTHPRHFERYSLTPKGQFVPNGRSDRFAVLVDVRRTQSADAVDEFIAIEPGRDFEALWTLRALAQDLALDAEQVLAATGVKLEVFQALMQRMKAAHFGVFLYGMGLTMSRGKHLNTEALLALTRDMNAHTRFVAKAMRGQGNVVGADNVVNWRTGYPFGVNLSRGYPRFNPGEYTTNESLARREIDAALIVADELPAEFDPAAREHFKSIPIIAVDSKETPTTHAAAVAFRTATYGIHAPGTVYRMDDVPLPLRPAVDSPYPSDQEVLELIEKRILELRHQPPSAAVPQHTAR